MAIIVEPIPEEPLRPRVPKPQLQPPAAPTAHDVGQMSRAELDSLFRRGEVGQIPAGEADGTAIIFPGNRHGRVVQKLVKRYIWQGKMLDTGHRTLKNRILPFGWHAISGDLYWDTSWFDGAECIVLDYTRRSLVARMVRDEIRRVAPGLYLGLVYWGKTRSHRVYFTLQFPV